MSMLNKIASMIQTGVIQFINLVGLTNQDYPLHDYAEFVIDTTPVAYVVGTNNRASGGDQKKLFTSKRTLIYSNSDAMVRFNNANNVGIYIMGNIWFEFYQNIHTLIVPVLAEAQTLYVWFEGTKPEECRIGA